MRNRRLVLAISICSIVGCGPSEETCRKVNAEYGPCFKIAEPEAALECSLKIRDGRKCRATPEVMAGLRELETRAQQKADLKFGTSRPDACEMAKARHAECMKLTGDRFVDCLASNQFPPGCEAGSVSLDALKERALAK
jgi:hypothetical protein